MRNDEFSPLRWEPRAMRCPRPAKLALLFDPVRGESDEPFLVIFTGREASDETMGYVHGPTPALRAFAHRLGIPVE